MGGRGGHSWSTSPTRPPTQVGVRLPPRGILVGPQHTHGSNPGEGRGVGTGILFFFRLGDPPTHPGAPPNSHSLPGGGGSRDPIWGVNFGSKKFGTSHQKQAKEMDGWRWMDRDGPTAGSLPARGPTQPEPLGGGGFSRPNPPPPPKGPGLERGHLRGLRRRAIVAPPHQGHHGANTPPPCPCRRHLSEPEWGQTEQSGAGVAGMPEKPRGGGDHPLQQRRGSDHPQIPTKIRPG